MEEMKQNNYKKILILCKLKTVDLVHRLLIYLPN